MAGMSLGELVEALELLDAETKVCGFGEPHSYRGYYADIAFEPSNECITAIELRRKVKGCVGQTFHGWKGGDYEMVDATRVWISEVGTASGLRLSGLLIRDSPLDGEMKAQPWTVEETW